MARGGGSAYILTGGIAKALQPAAWFRKGQGITVTGAGVSQWDDQSGNARPLLQATDAARPALQADGTILFNGTSHFLSAVYVANQPRSRYIVVKQVSWTLNDNILGAVGATDCAIYQAGASPSLYASAGVSLGPNSNLAVGSYGVVAAVFNGASSSIRVNNTAAVTGNAGAGNAGGISVGVNRLLANQFANIQVQEIIDFDGVHDTTKQNAVIRYLASVGGVAL